MRVDIERVGRAVASALAAACAKRARDASTPLTIAVALSGGRDSITLLHALARARQSHAMELRAIHVHHGLSPNADRWAEFCEHACARTDVPLRVERVEVHAKGGESIEDLARRARMRALLREPVEVVALAHHADDQAETLLLQLLRGAGPHGLAAMPMERTVAGTTLMRPLLSLPRSLLAAYARAHGLQWIDDESNADTKYRRNALRTRVIPVLRSIFPGYPDTLVRAAEHQGEAAALLDALAGIDVAAMGVHDSRFGLCLDHHAFVCLANADPARARNVLRWFMRSNGAVAPSTARLAEILKQCLTARRDAKLCVRHGDVAVSLHAGRLVVRPVSPSTMQTMAWSGEADMPCPGGLLRARLSRGEGLAASLATSGSLRLRTRRDGDRVAVAARDTPIAVSKLFTARRTPLWQRDEWPLVCLEDRVVAVPGLALDPQFTAPGGGEGYVLQWMPGGRAAPP